MMAQKDFKNHNELQVMAQTNLKNHNEYKWWPKKTLKTTMNTSEGPNKLKKH